MTPHAAFIRRAGARHYRCTTCHERVAPGHAPIYVGLDGA